MELRALNEAVKLADGASMVISDYDGPIRTTQAGKTPVKCKAIWEELYAGMAGKDVVYEWRRRDQTLGQRLAPQLAQDTAMGGDLLRAWKARAGTDKVSKLRRIRCSGGLKRRAMLNAIYYEVGHVVAGRRLGYRRLHVLLRREG